MPINFTNKDIFQINDFRWIETMPIMVFFYVDDIQFLSYLFSW